MSNAGFSAWALPGDTLDGYFRRHVSLTLTRVEKLEKRTDVLFSRRDPSVMTAS
jgi:hypothetical protein